MAILRNYFFFLNKNEINLFSLFNFDEYYFHFKKIVNDLDGFIAIQVSPNNVGNLLIALEKLGMNIHAIICLLYRNIINLDCTSLDRSYSLCVIASKNKINIRKMFGDVILVDNMEDTIKDLNFFNLLFKSTYSFERKIFLLNNNKYLYENMSKVQVDIHYFNLF